MFDQHGADRTVEETGEILGRGFDARDPTLDAHPVQWQS
jgi:hypothetical protein